MHRGTRYIVVIVDAYHGTRTYFGTERNTWAETPAEHDAVFIRRTRPSALAIHERFLKMSKTRRRPYDGRDGYGRVRGVFSDFGRLRYATDERRRVLIYIVLRRGKPERFYESRASRGGGRWECADNAGPDERANGMYYARRRGTHYRYVRPHTRKSNETTINRSR